MIQPVQPLKACAAGCAIQSIGEVRCEVDYIQSLLETTLDMVDMIHEARGATTADERRACNLVRIARDMTASVGQKLDDTEKALGERVRERAAMPPGTCCG